MLITVNRVIMIEINNLIFKCETNIIWNKVFKNGPSKICGRQPLKNLKFKFFKGCLPQILLGSLLNTLSHIILKAPVNISQGKDVFQT